MKKAKEYLLSLNISLTHPDVIRILNLVEKHPNYEYFFLKAHFGKENIPVDEIEYTFNLMLDKNIKVSKSVDQYVKYIINHSFEQPIIYDDGTIRAYDFKKNEDVTKRIKFIYKENRVFVDQRTSFEEFADEIRDALIKLTANKIIQQFPANGKKVVESLTEEEKKQFYFNLNTLLDTNIKYIANSFTKTKSGTITVGKKISRAEFSKVPSELKSNFSEITEKPLQAFIKKSARYKSKEALFADLSAALYSLSGDEEYKLTVELVEDTDGAILEGLNPEKGIVVASTLNAEAYKRVGGDKTSHCIRNQHTFSGYQKFGGKQYLIVNTKLDPADDYRIIGLTIDGNNRILNAHTKSDANILSDIHRILVKWGIAQYVKSMTADEIIEMLYFVIADETVFSNEDRAQMVIKYLPQLDESRYDKKKMINLLRFTKNETEMKKIIRMSLDMRNSEEFLENYNYLVTSILNVVSDDKQAHEMVLHFVREYNDTVGLTKEDSMAMLLNPSKYVQPNRLIEIIGKKKFVEFVIAYDSDQVVKILTTLPQLFIYFLRDKKTTGAEIELILNSMYKYEKRPDIRQIVLKKMGENGHLKKVNRTNLSETGILNQILTDDPVLAQMIS